MAVSVTIRNVPEDVRDELASRAAAAGRSLQEYLRLELVELALRPTSAVVMANAARRTAATASRLPAERILAHRDGGRT